MIVATAGHVDHGKTSLIRALTGVDTDRLPEEKARGLSIDLGFAYRFLDSGAVLGFVDVPGHDRFISNMLAGTAAIDRALLIVAADDGAMPQTREHLAILDLLGVAGGDIVLTKIDRVTPEGVESVARQVRELVAGTVFEHATVFPVSSQTGSGIDLLRAHLEAEAVAHERAPASGHFRLAVDRCFTLTGVGVVVTGAVLSGSVRTNDQLNVSPRGLPVRVRSLRAQSRAADSAQAGDRVALNLIGQRLHREDIRRGDWLVAPPAHNPTVRLDARIDILATEQRDFRSFTPVHVHLGATDVPARVVMIETRELAPGESALAQVVLARPVVAAHGDRFIVRDQSARRTIGGGRVLDPLAPLRSRGRAARAAFLRALDAKELQTRLQAALGASEAGLDLNWFCRAMNLTDEVAASLLEGADCVCTDTPVSGFAIQRGRWDRLRAELLATVRSWHEKWPEKLGLSALEFARLTEVPVVAAVLQHALDTLVADGGLRQEAGRYFVPGHRATFSTDEARLWTRVHPLLQAGGTRPPVVPEIADRLGIDSKRVVALLDRAVELGLAHRVAPTRFFLPEAVERLARVAEKLSSDRADGCFEASAYRDHSGIGRRVSVQMLEFFDRIGLTRRVESGRKLVRSPSQMFNGRESSPGGTPGLQNR